MVLLFTIINVASGILLLALLSELVREMCVLGKNFISVSRRYLILMNINALLFVASHTAQLYINIGCSIP